MIKNITLTIMLLTLSTMSFAGEFSGKVRALYVNNDGKVLINIKNDSTQPNCHQALWQFTFNISQPAAKEWMSMLLTSRASDTSIRLGYVDNPVGECQVVYFFYYD